MLLMCDNIACWIGKFVLLSFHLPPEQCILLVVLDLLHHPLEVDLCIADRFGGVGEEGKAKIYKHFLAGLEAEVVMLAQLIVHTALHLEVRVLT